MAGLYWIIHVLSIKKIVNMKSFTQTGVSSSYQTKSGAVLTVCLIATKQQKQVAVHRAQDKPVQYWGRC